MTYNASTPYSKGCTAGAGWLLHVPATRKSISGSDQLNCTCCHTEIDAAHQTCYLILSSQTDTGTTSPNADPVMPGTWQGSHQSTSLEIGGITLLGKLLSTQSRCLQPSQEPVCQVTILSAQSWSLQQRHTPTTQPRSLLPNHDLYSKVVHLPLSQGLFCPVKIFTAQSRSLLPSQDLNSLLPSQDLYCPVMILILYCPVKIFTAQSRSLLPSHDLNSLLPSQDLYCPVRICTAQSGSVLPSQDLYCPVRIFTAQPRSLLPSQDPYCSVKTVHPRSQGLHWSVKICTALPRCHYNICHCQAKPGDFHVPQRGVPQEKTVAHTHTHRYHHATCNPPCAIPPVTLKS